MPVSCPETAVLKRLRKRMVRVHSFFALISLLWLQTSSMPRAHSSFLSYIGILPAARGFYWTDFAPCLVHTPSISCLTCASFRASCMCSALHTHTHLPFSTPVYLAEHSLTFDPWCLIHNIPPFLPTFMHSILLHSLWVAPWLLHPPSLMELLFVHPSLLHSLPLVFCSVLHSTLD